MRRREDEGRARRAVLSGLAVFALGQLLLAGLIETRLKAVRDPVFFARLEHLKRRLADAGPGARTVLFLGTSRFAAGVQSRLLEGLLGGELGRPVVVANWGRGG